MPDGSVKIVMGSARPASRGASTKPADTSVSDEAFNQ
jgi:hypothetical protein